jgi:hypothetical protein
MNATTRRRVARRTSAVVGTATVVALLAGCAEELPQPTAEEPFTGPMLTTEQETAVIEDVGAALEAATGEHDPDRLGSRVSGPALQARTAELEIAQQADDDSLITEIPTSTRTMVLPTTQTWPRTSFNVTEPTEGLGVNRLVAYRQDSARDNYAMWAWVQLIPGTTLPNFADAEVIGSIELAPDDDSLTVTPADALAQYADVVQKGEESEHAGAFELPAETQDLAKRVQLDARNLRENEDFENADGEVGIRIAPQSELAAVRVSDGGAVVMGALDGNVVLRIEEDGELAPITASQKALVGDDDPTNELYTEYIDQVALYIPPAGSDALVRPIGYTRVPTSVDTSVPDERNTDRE